MAQTEIARTQNVCEDRASLAAGTGVPLRQQHSQRGLVISVGTVLVAVTCVLALFTATECYQFNSQAVPNFPWAPSLAYGGVFWFWWAAVGFAVWAVAKRCPRMLLLNLPSVLLQSCIGLGATTLHLLTMHAVVRLTPVIWPVAQAGTDSSLSFFVPARVSLDFLVYAFLWSTCAVLRFHMSSQQETMNSLALERQLSEAKLRALQTQLEPHFLFNTLNAISTLVNLGRQQEASDMLAHLNIILRTTLGRSSSLKVPVSQELEIVENYLAIEQIRFADRLRVETRVDPSALDCMMPSFLLQPLVENAIRHGITQREVDGIVQTTVSVEGDALHMRICDNGPGSRAAGQRGHGIGLQNTAERLSHFYPERHAMRIVEPEAGGFEVQIVIPCERYVQ